MNIFGLVRPWHFRLLGTYAIFFPNSTHDWLMDKILSDFYDFSYFSWKYRWRPAQYQALNTNLNYFEGCSFEGCSFYVRFKKTNYLGFRFFKTNYVAVLSCLVIIDMVPANSDENGLQEKVCLDNFANESGKT